MQARLWLPDQETRAKAEQEGKGDGTAVLDLEDLCSGRNVFFAATGITDGELLEGVRFVEDNRCHTQSLVMRSYSGTIRYIDAEHSLEKLRLRQG